MDNKQKVLNLIGLAAKAGKTKSGETSVEKAVKDQDAFLVFVADDASDNTKKLFTDKCTYYRVPVCFFASKEELGHCIGKDVRSSVAVLDKGFANALVKQMNLNGGSKYESK